MNTLQSLAASALVAAAAFGSGPADAQGYPWRNHDAPYDFVFGNDIDNHQQTRLGASGGLQGFLYLTYTGAVTTDGYPVAVHADCSQAAGCRVGWLLRGVPASAVFLFHATGDHPTWQIARPDIPQPGAYSHFHFLGMHPEQPGERLDGFLLELQAIDRFCFLHDAPHAAADTCANLGGVRVTPGIDIATHLNIVASVPPPQ
jgi:hypothetical protein